MGGVLKSSASMEKSDLRMNYSPASSIVVKGWVLL
jgi:hypothetical protein